MSSISVPSRRALLRGALGSAAAFGLGGLGAVATAAPARAYGVPPTTWTITGDGWSGQLNFWKRIRHTDDGTFAVLGDFSQLTPILAFGYGTAGLSLVRILDPWLRQFQVFRGDMMTEPRGHFSTYTRGSDGYYSHTPWKDGFWRVTAKSGLPLGSLAVDDTVVEHGGFTFTETSQFGEHTGGLVKLHGYNRDDTAPDDTVQFWGRCFAEAVVGLTLGHSRWNLVGTQYYDDNADGSADRKVKVYDMPYGFIRPVDAHFDRFHVYAGVANRLNYFRKGSWPQPTWIYDYAVYGQQGASWNVIEPVAGRQELLSHWWTNTKTVF